VLLDDLFKSREMRIVPITGHDAVAQVRKRLLDQRLDCRDLAARDTCTNPKDTVATRKVV